MGYELLIKLCDCSEPVERTVLVPKNITFKRLADIINLVFGWNNNPHHSFVFLDQPKIITSSEDQYRKIKEANALGQSKPKCSVSRSQSIIIDRYFEEPHRIRYYYGENPVWEHDLEVIAVREDYLELYPKLLDFTGENVCCEAKGVTYFNELTYYKQNKIENEDFKELKAQPPMNLNLVNIYLQAGFIRRVLKEKKKEKEI